MLKVKELMKSYQATLVSLGLEEDKDIICGVVVITSLSMSWWIGRWKSCRGGNVLLNWSNKEV